MSAWPRENDLHRVWRALYFGARYAVCYIDEKSRIRFVVIIRDMTAASQEEAFKRYRAFFHYWTGEHVSGFMSDGGPAYVANSFRDLCDEDALFKLTTVPYNHQGNALPEQLWSTSFPRVRANLLDMFGDTSGREQFVIRFWALALLLQVNYISNRMPLLALKGVSPLQYATGERQTLRWLHVFGESMTAIVPDEKRGNKTDHFMEPVARPAAWCGIAETCRGHVAYMLDTGTVEYVAEAKFQPDDKPMHRQLVTPSPPSPEPVPDDEHEAYAIPDPIEPPVYDTELYPVGHDQRVEHDPTGHRPTPLTAGDTGRHNRRREGGPPTLQIDVDEDAPQVETDDAGRLVLPMRQPPAGRPPSPQWNLAGEEIGR